jgi:hypothetical protein
MSPGVIGARRIVPVDKTSYVDGLQLWLKDPLPRIQLEWLATQCDSIDVRQQLKRWDRAYRVRLQMRRPNHEALQWLATLTGVLMNYAELSLDWTFDSEELRRREGSEWLENPCRLEAEAVGNHPGKDGQPSDVRGIQEGLAQVSCEGMMMLMVRSIFG